MAFQMELSLNNINDTSYHLYKQIFEENIKKSFDELHDKIKLDITENIMKKIRGDNTYDYSTIPEIPNIFDFKTILNNFNAYKYADEIKTLGNKFLKNNEIYIFIDNLYDHNNLYNSTNYNNYYRKKEIFVSLKDESVCAKIYLTNNARIICVVYDKTNPQINVIKTLSHNFWIPVDYIKIILILIKNIKKFTLTNNHNRDNPFRINQDSLYNFIQLYDNLDELLKYIKETLYSSKFIPLYIKEEHEKIKVEYEQLTSETVKINQELLQEKDKLQELTDNLKLEFNKEKECLNKEKETFELETKPYIDLINDRLKLKEEKRKLDIEIATYNINLQKLNKEKIELSNMKLSYSKLMNKLEYAKLMKEKDDKDKEVEDEEYEDIEDDEDDEEEENDEENDEEYDEEDNKEKNSVFISDIKSDSKIARFYLKLHLHYKNTWFDDETSLSILYNDTGCKSINELISNM